MDAVNAAGTSAVAIVGDQTGEQLHFFRVLILFSECPRDRRAIMAVTSHILQ